jgi:small conductance mechanosensitive channel
VVSRRLRAGRQLWRELAVTRRLTRERVKRARVRALVLLPLIAATLLLAHYRNRVVSPDWEPAVRGLMAALLLVLGWILARDLQRGLAPTLFRRLDTGTAGAVDFVLRLVTVLVVVVVALRMAGISPRALAVGGAVSAVVVGLAAQQTLGNLFAGTVLISARPFRVGDRVRLQGGPLAGAVEGVASSFGLLYSTFASGEDRIMIPNAVVLSVAVVPLREPTAVELRARLHPGITPLDVEENLRRSIETPLRGPPRITLEEVDDDEVVVRIAATPVSAADGPRLASEVLAAIASQVYGSDEPRG